MTRDEIQAALEEAGLKVSESGIGGPSLKVFVGRNCRADLTEAVRVLVECAKDGYDAITIENEPYRSVISMW